MDTITLNNQKILIDNLSRSFSSSEIVRSRIASPIQKDLFRQSTVSSSALNETPEKSSNPFSSQHYSNQTREPYSITDKNFQHFKLASLKNDQQFKDNNLIQFLNFILTKLIEEFKYVNTYMNNNNSIYYSKKMLEEMQEDLIKNGIVKIYIKKFFTFLAKSYNDIYTSYESYNKNLTITKLVIRVALLH